MKNLFLTILFFSIILNINAQEKDKETLFYSISFSPLNIYSDNTSGGLGLNADVSFNKGNHIFKIYLGCATEFKLFGGAADTFVEYNLLYGRKLEITKWVGIDLFAGLGYFNFSDSSLKSKKETIGFPLQGKIRFNTGPKFSLGLQLHRNTNNVKNVNHYGIFLQWKL